MASPHAYERCKRCDTLRECSKPCPGCKLKLVNATLPPTDVERHFISRFESRLHTGPERRRPLPAIGRAVFNGEGNAALYPMERGETGRVTLPDHWIREGVVAALVLRRLDPLHPPAKGTPVIVSRDGVMRFDGFQMAPMNHCDARCTMLHNPTAPRFNAWHLTWEFVAIKFKWTPEQLRHADYADLRLLQMCGY